MPMPHRTYQQVIRRRLQGKEGPARVRELRRILDELPGYRNGPYADLRKWVETQLSESRVRGKVVHHDTLAVRREGVAQIALVGAPNAGKSSLLQALSGVQIKTGDYAFTTTRPIPATIRAGGVLVQLVEIPGLIAGATEDRGRGRSLLGVLRGADAAVLCHPATSSADELDVIRTELAAAAIHLPTMLAITKADEAEDTLRGAHADAVVVSVLDDASLDRFREALFRLTGLVRIHLCKDGNVDDHPLAMRPPVTVADVARAIHGDVASRCRGALVWGPTARFPGQRLGPGHVLVDGDCVEVLA